MDKIVMMKAMIGMLLEINSNDIEKIAAKEFVNFLTSDEVPFEEKVSCMLSLDLNDIISHLDDEDVKVLHKEIVKLHKCSARFFNKLQNKTI